MSFLKSKHSGWTWDMKRTPYMGGGGGSPGPTTSYTQTSNIPDYAEPYVHSMLGATQKQMFTLDDANQVVGFQPYKPYSTNVNDYIAGFSPLQQQAQQSAYGLQTPGQFAPATGLAALSGMGSLGAGQQYASNVTNPASMQAYMSPYQQGVTDIAKNAAIREAQMANVANKLGAARQGTYGGAREILGRTERERNLLSNLSNIQAQGSQAAYDRALQSQQFGANLGLQGYGQAGQMAGQLGQLGTQQLAAQTGIIGTQAAQGLTQQQQEQSKINQAIQDYATQQQYPLMQLGFMSNMLRGLPMQAQTTQMYQAQPSTLQQGIGLLGAGASLYGAGKAEGGQIKEMAEGGITGYKYGGAIPEPKLAGMAQNLSVEQLKARLQDPQLDSGERQIFADALADKTKEKARSEGIAAAGGGLFNTMGYAGGGILAFADEGQVKDPEELANQINLIGAQLDAVNKEAGGRTAPGSKQRAFAPEKVAEFENLQKRKSELQSEYSDLMSKAGLDKPAIGYRSGVAPTTLYPNSTEQALLGTKPPQTSAMPTAGEFKAFDEATERFLAEQKAGKGKDTTAGPTTGATASRASSAGSGSTGAGPSGLSGILANLRKEGPQGELGADYLEKLKALEAGADQRLSKADKIAMAKGFLKFASTPAPGGIGQAMAAGLGEYTEGYAKAIDSDEKFRMETAKLQNDILALRRAEERGDVKLAADLQDKIADRSNRLQVAQIGAAASHSAGAREEGYVKQLMAQGMSLEQALQVVKGAGKFESNDIQKAKLLLADINEQLFALGADPKKNAAKIADLEAKRNAITQSMAVGGGKTSAGGGGNVMRFDAKGNPV